MKIKGKITFAWSRQNRGSAPEIHLNVVFENTDPDIYDPEDRWYNKMISIPAPSWDYPTRDDIPELAGKDIFIEIK
jgi:hypothetical protein